MKPSTGMYLWHKRIKITARTQIVGIIILTLFGAFMRFKGLGFREFWYDEAFSGFIVKQDWGGMFSFISADIHPPLYYVLLKLWTNLFGHTDYAIRSISAVFGTLLIPVSWNFVKTVYSKDKGWIPLVVAFLIAVNPFLIDYSQEARSYSLLALILLLAGHFFYKGLIKSPLKFNLDWFLFSVLISAAVLTHYLAMIGIISFFIFALVYIIRTGLIKRSTLKLFTLYVKLLLIPVFAALMWLPTISFQRGSVSNLTSAWAWIPYSEFSFIPRSLYAFFFGVDRQAIGIPPVNEISTILSSESISFILYSMILGASFYLFKRFKGEEKIFLTFVLSMWVLPIVLTIVASSFGFNLYVERYLIAYGVFFILYSVLIVSKFTNRFTIPTIILLYIIILSTMATQHQNPGYTELTSELKETNRRIIFNDPFHFVVARYYLGIDFDQRIKIYDFKNVWGYKGWALIEDYQVLDSPSDFKDSDLLIATNLPDTIYYEDSVEIGEFRIYENWGFEP